MKGYIFALLCLVVIATAENPGLRVTISNDALNYLMRQVLPDIVAQVKTTKIDDMEDEVSTPIGKAKIDITNIKLDDFSVENVSVALADPNVVTVSLTGIALSMEYNWHYKTWIASDGGSGTADTDDATAVITVTLAKNETGGLVVTVSQTVFDCGSLDVHLSGGASWLYNVLLKWFRGKMRDNINKEVSEQMATTLQEKIDDALDTVPIVVDLGKNVSTTFAIADDPSVSNERVIVGCKAESYVTDEGPGHSPFTPADMPKTTINTIPGPMVEMLVNEFVVNTLSYAFINAGNAHMEIDEKNAPVAAKPLLVTGAYAAAAPGLVKQYGLVTPVRLRYDVSQVPTVYMEPDGFRMETIALLSMDVNQDGNYTEVIVIQLNLDQNGTVTLKNNRLTAKIDGSKASSEVTKTTVGDVNIKAMQDLFDFIVPFVTDTLNVILAIGYPLPIVKGVKLINPQLTWASSYLIITSDFEYNL